MDQITIKTLGIFDEPDVSIISGSISSQMGEKV
jgi:hypothetical protein